MEVTIHHEHHHGMEARLRKKLELVQTALRLDRDVLDEMRGEISGFRSAFARTKALALERAASLEAENAQRFAINEGAAAGAEGACEDRRLGSDQLLVLEQHREYKEARGRGGGLGGEG